MMEDLFTLEPGGRISLFMNQNKIVHESTHLDLVGWLLSLSFVVVFFLKNLVGQTSNLPLYVNRLQ